MEEFEHIHNTGVLLQAPIHARCGHSEIAIQEIGPAMLTATHFDRIYLGQNRVLAIPNGDVPMFIPCRIIRSRVTDWRDERTGKCLYRSVFEFLDLTEEMRQAIDRLLGRERSAKNT